MHFTIKVEGSKEVISLDILKPAFLDMTIPLSDSLLLPTTQTTMTTSSQTCEASSDLKTITHSGRRVRWPFNSFSGGSIMGTD